MCYTLLISPLFCFFLKQLTIVPPNREDIQAENSQLFLVSGVTVALEWNPFAGKAANRLRTVQIRLIYQSDYSIGTKLLKQTFSLIKQASEDIRR